MDKLQRYFAKSRILVQMGQAARAVTQRAISSLPKSCREAKTRLRLGSRALRRWVQPYARKTAFRLWFGGSAGMALAVGLGGTSYESIAGSIILVNELYGSLLKENAVPNYLSFSSALFWSCLCLQRWPEITSHPSTSLLMATMVAVNLPLIFKPVVKPWAEERLKTFIDTGKHLSRTPKDRVRGAAITALANPTQFAQKANLSYFALCILGIVWDGLATGNTSHLNLLWPYPAWLLGNHVMGYTDRVRSVKRILGQRHRRESLDNERRDLVLTLGAIKAKIGKTALVNG